MLIFIFCPYNKSRSVSFVPGDVGMIMLGLTLLSQDKMAAILADEIFKCICWNKNDEIPIQISLKFVPRSPIDNNPALFQGMTEQATIHYLKQWRPSSLTHICGSRGRWVDLAATRHFVQSIFSTPFVNTMLVSCNNDEAHKQLWPLLLTWFNFNPSMDK